jgi:O-antigen/teichoic acid export membrane protein
LGRYRAWAVISLVTVGIQLALSLALIAELGLNGLAVAYNVAWAWAAVAATIVIARHGMLPPRRDWAIAAIGIAIPAATLVTWVVSPPLAATVAVITSAGWVWLVRRDLAALGDTLLASIRSRRRGSDTTRMPGDR